MSRQPAICVVTAAAQPDANRVWEAMGRGTGTFSRKLTDDPSPTTTSTVTHYLMADSSALVSDVQEWQALANGDLPQIAGVWGEEGIISAADAMAATNGANLQVYTASGDVAPYDHAMAILDSRGLAFVPDDF